MSKYILALCRFTREITVRSPMSWGQTTYRPGDQRELIWWGDSWWTSFDIDYALIFPSDAVEVVEIRREWGDD